MRRSDLAPLLVTLGGTVKERIRWLSIPDVTDLVLGRTNRVAERIRARPRRSQLQAVRRLVLQVERRDEVRISKRVPGKSGTEIMVRLDAVESLLPSDAAAVTRLETDLVSVATENKKIWRHVGAHGARLRDHEKRIQTLEEEQELTTKYLADLNAIRSRAKGT